MYRGCDVANLTVAGEGGGFRATAAQRAKFAQKVHKLPLMVNIINFELNGFNASIWVPGNPSDPQKLSCIDRNVQIHRYLERNNMHFSTFSIISVTFVILAKIVSPKVKCGRHV